MTTLNDENYYEKQWEFMSASQYKSFTVCEAKALAELTGEIPKENTEAFLVGNYVHSAFEGDEAHEQFKKDHEPEMLTKQGKLRAAFIVAEEMVQRLKKDTFFNNLYQGEKEVIITGKLHGEHWKGKIDCLNIEQGYFVDIKTTADIHKKIWSENRRVWIPFVEAYGYYEQMAIYKNLLEQKYKKEFTPYIIAVSKQSPCDLEAIEIREELLVVSLNNIKGNLERVSGVKNGEIKPRMCGKCDYCRGHKELSGFVSSEELIS
ncbi:PD-(D/E)XK nuclease-like domain-containing protein [Enterococcus wangshanyuanii]|uniref:Putative exodeoxyribonuclease 8 PDDEXK-like domain-containing protein n=1 Tax=Enterococcus wangshanyuanii TaxID=2005703 RepID=A0ABQ1PWN3_9ENTE|nr:PD-(D/E)XK nuclease-like domain-containing protein [Enterococcus wangshanyuanii]GGD05750.1 hypothetical protein GCM10011573_38960 [Enterococcus wangshanyuanii]